MKVDVYWNLHKSMWSVRHKGKVIQHRSDVHIKDAQFVVQPAGRAKVTKTRRKNVHAFVRGQLSVPFITQGFERVRYNPYKFKTFVDAKTESPLATSDMVYLDSEGRCFADLGGINDEDLSPCEKETVS